MATEMELILDGTTMYMRMPTLAGTAGIATEWISMDIDEVAPGFERAAALSQGQNDPTSSLAYLDGITDAEAVGTETVAGVATTHYHGTVDPTAALRPAARRHSTPTHARRSRRPRKRAGHGAMPVDVWIDGDGLLRRMTCPDGVRARNGGRGLRDGDDDGDPRLRDRRCDLPIPTADEVTDVTDLLPALP